jgi:hypothetical protein
MSTAAQTSSASRDVTQWATLAKIQSQSNPNFANLSENSAEICRIAKSRPSQIHQILENSAKFVP